MPQIPLTEGYRIAPENPGTQEQFHNIRPNTQVTENWGKVGTGLTGGLALRVGEAMEQAIDDADRTQALTLANELRKRASEFTYGKDGKGGYLNEKGVNALNGNLPEVFGDRLTKAAEELGKKANVRSRKYFNQYAAKISQGFHDGIDRHIYKESLAVKASERTKSHDMDTQDILQATENGDYEGMYSSILQSADRVKQFAAEDGVEPDLPKVVGNQVMMAASMMMQKNADYKTLQGFAAGAKASGYLTEEQATRLSKAVKEYVLDKKTDDLADKAFARFSNNEAAGMAWIEKQKVSSDPDENAIASRKLAERYNRQDQVKQAGYKQAKDLFATSLLAEYSRGNAHPNPAGLRGWIGLSPQDKAAYALRYRIHVESEQKSRMHGGGGGGRAKGDNAIVSGIPTGTGANDYIPITKGDMTEIHRRISYLLGTDDGREMLGKQDFSGRTRGLDKFKDNALMDGIPWGSILAPKELQKLQEKLSKGLDGKAKQTREQAEAYLIDVEKVDRDRAKSLAGAIGNNADDLLTANKNVMGTKEWNPNLLLTANDRAVFIQEQLTTLKKRKWLGFPFGETTLAEATAKNKRARMNAITSGKTANEADRESVAYAPLAPETTIAQLKQFVFYDGLGRRESTFRPWAMSIHETGQKITDIKPTGKQKAILSAVSQTTGAVDVNRLPDEIYKAARDEAAKKILQTDPTVTTKKEALRYVYPDKIADAAVELYFKPVSTKTSAGSVANTSPTAPPQSQVVADDQPF